LWLWVEQVTLYVFKYQLLFQQVDNKRMSEPSRSYNILREDNISNVVHLNEKSQFARTMVNDKYVRFF
jgi:hypothetical protein